MYTRPRPRRFGIESARARDQAHRSHAEISQAQGANFKPLPTPVGQPPYRLALSDIVPSATRGSLSLHVIGDSGGVKDPVPQEAVAAAMQADHAERPVALCWTVGDVVYFNGAESEYAHQFYEPYAHYNVPTMGVPGNHDGDSLPGEESLAGFMRNFCSPQPTLLPEFAEFQRDTMDQPNCFWTLTSGAATIVGLYSNVPEGGEIAADQAAWLVGELKAADPYLPLIVALHHPPYSADGHHGGSSHMGGILDDAFAKANRWPQLVLAGHVHNYQRFTRPAPGQPRFAEITYCVTGASGYHNLYAVASQDGRPVRAPFPIDDRGVTLESYCDDRWGFLRLDIAAGMITGEYIAVTRDGARSRNVDTFTIPSAAL